MKILSVGWFDKVSNTSLHRHNAIVENYLNVDAIDCATETTFGYRIANKLFNLGFPLNLPDKIGVNEKILDFVKKNSYDLVWIDKGVTVKKSTLIFIKRVNENTKIVSFTADNMALRHNQSQDYLDCFPFYDFHITTKSFIVDTLLGMKAKNVIFTNQTYQADFHYPRTLTVSEKKDFEASVGFVGVWEKERSDSIKYLVDNGLNVTVYGDGNWKSLRCYSPRLKIMPSIFSDDYPKVLSALKISLCFLRKINTDQHTSRSIEIPACGGFMLAERTDEHLALFEEGKEAEFFSSDEELLEKCRYYLNNEEERKAIVERGILRCKNSGYSNIETMKKLIDAIIKT